MTNNEKEIWRAYPDIAGIEVSTMGRVRTLDRVVSSEYGTRFTKGKILKQSSIKGGYLLVSVPVDGKWTNKFVHRLVAEAFIPNPDNLPQVNHKDCNPQNNNVENLEWCTASYNQKYREKHGVSQTEAAGHPMFAINLTTMEVSHFRSQQEAGRAIGINEGNINSVINGKMKQACGYWFKADDGNGIEIDKDKLNDIVAGMRFTGGVFAVNLNTLEVSRFNSQKEASEKLMVNAGNINGVIKGRLKRAGNFWFTNDDDKIDDAIKSKFHDIKKIHS